MSNNKYSNTSESNILLKELVPAELAPAMPTGDTIDNEALDPSLGGAILILNVSEHGDNGRVGLWGV